MNGLALLLYLVFFTAAFGWRSWVQWRRTGDTGLRLRAELGTVQWWAKLGFIVAIVAGVAAPLAGFAGLDPLPALDRTIVRGTGIVLAVTGMAATLWTQHLMGASWRVGVDHQERTELVTAGVFGLVRNPIFTAMLIAALGFALLVGNVVAVLAFVALVVALEVQVRRVEEPYLRSVHGADYDHYTATTGRFVPRIVPRIGRRPSGTP